MAVRPTLKRLRGAAWLGWQIEANWTDPTVFVIYRIARPLATALILAAMMHAVRGSASHEAAFSGYYVANAFHAFVDTVLIGMAWVVFEEREQYETLKYLVASPVGMVTYLAGRATVKFALAAVSWLMVLLVGWFVVGVRWDWAAVQWVRLLPSVVLGLVAVQCLGFLLAGWTLVLTRQAILAIEGVALSLLLMTGVLFPVDLLPGPLRAVTLALPFTWWYEAIRRFLLGHPGGATFGALSGDQLLAGLALVTVAFSVLALWGYAAFERLARRLGRLDQTTMY
jgi:ABC-2 type transport system permease protein